MKIIKVAKNEDDNYVVSLKYNWIERLFGCKDKDIEVACARGRYRSVFGVTDWFDIYVDRDANEVSDKIKDAIVKYKIWNLC